jgi:hypothetical protein
MCITVCTYNSVFNLKIAFNFQILLVGCLSVLEKEIIPESTPLTASAEYRKSLAIGLFYKVNSAFPPGCFWTWSKLTF